MKKILAATLLAMLVILAFGVAIFVVSPSEKEANAAYDLGWEPSIAYKEGTNYTFLSRSGVCMQSEVWIMISGWQNNHNYYFYVSTDLKQTVGDLPGFSESDAWTLINPNGATQKEKVDGTEYLVASYDAERQLVNGSASLYFYFCHTYSDGSISHTEYYAVEQNAGATIMYYYVTFNTKNGSENEFRTIYASYRARGASEDTQYRGAWTANDITFTVVTKNMVDILRTESAPLEDYVYNDTQEILSYSENFNAIYQPLYETYRRSYSDIEAQERAQTEASGRANWQLFTNGSNQVVLSKSLNGVKLWFRLTDIAGAYPHYAYYGTNDNGVNGEAILINLDPAEPRFEVTAQTFDLDSTQIPYPSAGKEWTSNPVSFTLTDTSKCISSITYQYSANGGAYVNLAANFYETQISLANLSFRATTAAGRSYVYSSDFNVKIDSVMPEIQTAGSTIDPDSSSASDICDKSLTSKDVVTEEAGILSMYTVYDYANNKVEVRVYNRDGSGLPVYNTSGVTFYYQEASARNLYTDAWQRMNDYETVGNERYYVYTLSIGTEVSLTRYVQFKIVSGAGLSSPVKEVSVTVVNSAFSFSLLEDNYLIANYNSDGWIADKAIIRAVLSADSRDFPTTQYTFYYWTDELTGEGSTEAKIKAQAESSVGSPVEFYDEKNGINLWVYEFELKNASANAIFNIRAMNAAKKLNGDTIKTYDVIRIDVKEPEYTWDAYIYPTTGEISSDDLKDVDKIRDFAREGKLLHIADSDNPDAGWVNGSIYFVLCVNVSVSGINLKDMAYAKDNDGNPMYDTSGNLVWQELTGTHKVDFHETNSGGSFGRYYYFFNLNNNDATKAISVQDYRYRIYTGSGISTDVSFTAKFDSTDYIRLQSVNVNSETGKNSASWTVTSGGDTVIYDSNFSLCENFSLTFTSSLDRAGIEDHYALYYFPFTADDMSGVSGGVPTDTELKNFVAAKGDEDRTSGTRNYLELTESSVNQIVQEDRQGVFYFGVYVKSKTRDWQNKSNVSGYYVIAIEYDTLNITIGYSLNIPLSASSTDEDDMSAGVWKTGSLEVSVSLPSDDNVTNLRIENAYTFFYMLLPYGAVNSADLLASESGWRAASGQYDGEGRYVFQIFFTDIAFHGTIGLSVCNKAMYRSIGYDSRKEIRIDNTNPDILKIIKGKTKDGLIEERTESTRKIVSINTKDEIRLDASEFSENNTSCSPIRFFYKQIPSIPTSISKIVYTTSADMIPLSSETPVEVFPMSGSFSRENFSTVYLMIFAINTVATATTGYAGTTEWVSALSGYEVTLTVIYEFNYDPSELTATALTPGAGADYGNLGIYEFLWQERVTVSTTIKSSKRSEVPNYYRFMFSVDSGLTWFNYIESGAVNYYTSDELKELVFSASSLAEYVSNDTHPFENGVMETFMFRAVNKAGSYVDCGSVFIAIDETTPEFNVYMYDQYNTEYVGGSVIDLNSHDENWTNGPISISLDITRMPASGVRVYYYLVYLNSNGTREQPLTAFNGGKGKELFSYDLFTTDRLDGFNLNRDAILVITVASRSGSSTERFRETSVRVSVDQQVPVFSLIGRATQENDEGATVGDERIIVSGDWTPLNTVTISKEVPNANVSNVVYTYTWQSESMSEPSGFTWSASEMGISRHESGKLIVTATSANGDPVKGKTYTVEFDINIDTTPPTIEFSGGINVIEYSEQYVDLQVVVHGDNLDIVEYITIKENTRGFTFDPTGYVLSTSSVDNSQRHAADEIDPDVFYRGYVHIYVRDKAGHEKHFELYVVPFPLTVNTIQLTDEDKTKVNELEHTLNLAKEAGYMEKSRIEYFENMISRLRDRMETLQTEIDGYRDYLEKLANRSSFELRSDYAEMFRYRTTFQNYEVYGQKWIQTAITGDSTSKYYAYYKNFLNQFDKLFALMEQVEKVEKHVTELPAINMVESEDYTDILRVYDEYFDLTQDQKSCFTANLYNKLMDLKEACEVLLLSDRDTGVVLDGDFAPGATVAVTKYEENTDTYQNAQTLLMNSVAADAPRAIVSIHRVALTGAYAQTIASDIKVQIPIPEEYRNYIEFSVYALADDGSMKKVSGSKIQPDGGSVQFSTESLGTYVLCVKADIQKTEIDSDSYGSVLGIPLTATMIKYLLYVGGVLLGVIFLVCIILGIRQRRFMNSYNRAYRNSIYRKQSRGVPKGNKF